MTSSSAARPSSFREAGGERRICLPLVARGANVVVVGEERRRPFVFQKPSRVVVATSHVPNSVAMAADGDGMNWTEDF
eukprot:4189942-Pleurochrysis_carterae.AAC.1